MIENYKNIITENYINFKGRARRKEYWLFQLVNFLVLISIYIVSAATNTNLQIIETLYLLFILLPNLAVSARRLHDINLSGWFLLLGLIPYIGNLVLCILFCLDSKENNKWGQSPKFNDEIDKIGKE